MGDMVAQWLVDLGPEGQEFEPCVLMQKSASLHQGV